MTMQKSSARPRTTSSSASNPSTFGANTGAQFSGVTASIGIGVVTPAA